jgi:hypothetical protein
VLRRRATDRLNHRGGSVHEIAAAYRCGLDLDAEAVREDLDDGR